MSMNNVMKYIGIMNLLLWISMFMSVNFLDLSNSALKNIAGSATFVVILTVMLDVWEDRQERTKKEAINEEMLEFIEKEKQGDK